MTLSAFNHTEQNLILVSAHEAELEKATDINAIFNLLNREYASFLNYDIFDFILTQHQLDHGQEELKYPEHLKAYLERHNVSEFVKVNPLFKKYTDTSKELVLKIDIESSSKLAKLKNLKDAIADILELKSATMRLLDLKDGCVVATFLIPTPVADRVFSKHPVLTDQQQAAFQKLPVFQLECNDYLVDFTAKDFKETDLNE